MDQTIRDRILGNIDEDRVIETTREILRIPSFGGAEQELAADLANRLDTIGLQVEMQEVEPGRHNVIGRLAGSGDGPSFMFNGHMDHNMVGDGWSRDPFSADYEDGWIIALGAVNMKSAVSAYLSAVEGIQRSGVRLSGDLVVEYVVGELEGGKGTRHALGEGVFCDYFIDGEPTELNIKTLHAGVVVVQVHVFGRMRHYHNYEGKAVHAIENMMKLLHSVGPSYAPAKPGGWLSFERRPGWDELPQHNVGSIRGGIGPDYKDWRAALCPDRCSVKIDIRTVPGQSPQSVVADLNRLIAQIAESDPDFRAEAILDEQHVVMPTFEIDPEHPLVRLVADTHTALRGTPPRVRDIGPAKLAGADSAHLSAAGMKGLLYGPGGRYVSVPDERVRARDVVTAAQVYAIAATATCGIVQ
jgi:acetylornithine deacetylase